MSVYLEENPNKNIGSFDVKKNVCRFGALLPNLRYDTDKGCVYYHSSSSIKLKSKKSKTGFYYQHKFYLPDIQLYGRMDIYNNVYYIDIIPEYFENGLKIHVTYRDPYNTIYEYHQQKIARAVEYQILGINMFRDCYVDEPFYENDFGINDILYDNEYEENPVYIKAKLQNDTDDTDNRDDTDNLIYSNK